MGKSRAVDPPYYTDTPITYLMVADEWKLPVRVAMALKYLKRYRAKQNPMLELSKAIRYLELEIERLAEESWKEGEPFGITPCMRGKATPSSVKTATETMGATSQPRPYAMPYPYCPNCHEMMPFVAERQWYKCSKCGFEISTEEWVNNWRAK